MSELNQRARATLKPLFVSVSFPKPTVTLALAVTPSPLVVSVTFQTPNTIVTPSPLVVSVTFPAPTVTLV